MLRWWFALCPLLAIALGAAVVHRHGIALDAFAPNLAALVLGGLAALVIVELRVPTKAQILLPALIFAATAATLLSREDQGVHRWVLLGPLRLNVSEALTPLLLGLLTASTPRLRWSALAAILGTQLVHLLQPDAAQATALAAGSTALLLFKAPFGRPIGAIASLLLLVLAVVSWYRPDPLPPIDQVERVLYLSASDGPIWLALALLSIALLFAPLFALPNHHGGMAYLLASFACTLVGNFPVPVLGAAAAPVLGWWLMVGSIARLARGDLPSSAG